VPLQTFLSYDLSLRYALRLRIRRLPRHRKQRTKLISVATLLMRRFLVLPRRLTKKPRKHRDRSRPTFLTRHKLKTKTIRQPHHPMPKMETVPCCSCLSGVLAASPFDDKFTIYAHQTFGRPAVIFPAFAAGMAMANPRKNYPREWKDGAGAFGRLYGASIATVTSQRTARFLRGVALHEDPRYVRSTSKNPLLRTGHALIFTFIDKTDSGRNTIAFSNFAGAAAGGFVGNAYLPHGYNDLTHAQQRMAFQFAGIAIQNMAAEFQPQWGPVVRKLRINKIIPEWWVPKHEN
jgi:hypothetical protein